MATEDVDPRFAELDGWPTANIMDAMWEGQMAAVAAVRVALPLLAAAVDAAAETLGDSGRLVYVGAGTSGRVAVQDGAELPPTFDWPQHRLVFAMAGGLGALTASVEGAEDDAADGARRMEAAEVAAHDVVIGIAASGTTPFTVAAVARARELGALTIGIASNPGAPLLSTARFPICIDTGSELIAGSTRMKAGTAQKAALNLISTGIMIRLGRVYRGMMVNMHLANAKLRRRAERMVARIAGVSPADAAQALAKADGDLKVAILTALGLAPGDARAALGAAKGNLRAALAAAGRSAP
jgi:N-acetylmuramic acid 6-phosphate etherase